METNELDWRIAALALGSVVLGLLLGLARGG